MMRFIFTAISLFVKQITRGCDRVFSTTKRVRGVHCLVNIIPIWKMMCLQFWQSCIDFHVQDYLR